MEEDELASKAELISEAELVSEDELTRVADFSLEDEEYSELPLLLLSLLLLQAKINKHTKKKYKHLHFINASHSYNIVSND
jgi:hypothetical protein